MPIPLCQEMDFHQVEFKLGQTYVNTRSEGGPDVQQWFYGVKHLILCDFIGKVGSVSKEFKPLLFHIL